MLPGGTVEIADWQIHRIARGRPRQVARHASFIRQHILSGVAGLAAGIGIHVAAGPLDTFEITAFALLAAMALPAGLLRLTGRLELSHSLSSLLLAALVGWLCLWTGGVDSFMLIWLAIVPLEAALSASRRTAALAAFVSLGVLAGLAWVSMSGGLPPLRAPSLDPFLVRMIALGAAIVYAGALAMRTQAAYQRAEDAADAEEARYRMVADNASDLITRHSIDGTVLFATPATRRLLGIGPDQLRGHRFQEIAGGEQAREIAEAFRSALREGGDVSVQFEVPATDGTPRHLETRVRATGGETEISLVAVTRDITERQAAAEAMEEARELSERANRAKSSFLRSMSHELRTPLNSIIGFAQIIREQAFGPIGNGRYSDYAGMIGDSGKSLLRVVTDVLRMSEIEAGEVQVDTEETALYPAVEAAVRELTPQANASGITLVNALPGVLPLAIADPRAATQTLQSIIANAIRYSDESGEVRIEAGSDGSFVWIDVTDDGRGIPAADIERIRRPFERSGGALEGRPSGAGVGLSIAEALTRLQGGELMISSEEGAGTCVRIAYQRAAISQKQSA